MSLEGFFEAVVGSKEGEFKPSSKEVMTEEELLKAFDKEEEEKQKEIESWRDKTSPKNLEEAEEKSSKTLDGSPSANKTLFVEFTNGEIGIFKPASGEAEGLRRYIDKGTLCKRERAAYLVDQFFDFGIVPPTVIKKIGNEVGSVQKFINDTASYWDVFNTTVIKEKEVEDQIKTLWVFDFLIHNSDRHMGNLLFSELHTGYYSDIKVHAIDNGCSFSRDSYQNSIGYPFGKELPDELAEKVKKFSGDEKSQQALRGLLLELLSEEEVDAFFGRVNKIGSIIIKDKKIPEEPKNFTSF
ncbi:MAG: hypothetical protein NTZ13_03410 [Candidatus Parcubacteria bacterium]|nr:hypothetical protein [Candidatus Parcubacteria bacterium]